MNGPLFPNHDTVPVPTGRPRETLSRADAEKHISELDDEEANLEEERRDLQTQIDAIAKERREIRRQFDDPSVEVVFVGEACVGCNQNEPDAVDLCEGCLWRIARMLGEGKHARQIAQTDAELYARIAVRGRTIIQYAINKGWIEL